jgi:hypothetical protein
MTSEFRSNRLADKRSFYCPNGHVQSYVGESDADKARRLEREARQLREQAEQARTRATAAVDQLEMERRSHTATKGHLTRQRMRAEAALCPVPGCGRSFKQLRRHLTSKHPDFVADGAQETVEH